MSYYKQDLSVVQNKDENRKIDDINILEINIIDL